MPPTLYHPFIFLLIYLLNWLLPLPHSGQIQLTWPVALFADSLHNNLPPLHPHHQCHPPPLHHHHHHSDVVIFAPSTGFAEP